MLKDSMVKGVLFAVLLVSTAIWGCKRSGSEGSAGAGDKLVIQNSGSDTMVNLAQAWAETYAKVNPAVSVEVAGGGSGTGIAALINGTVDIANASRDMRPEELESAKRNTGKEPIKFVVGYDALAVYVHPDNPLEEITLDQLAEIYGEGGTLTKWSQLGIEHPTCTNDEIIRVSRQSNSGTYFYFREHVLGKNRDYKLGSRDLHGSKDVVDLVSRTPCAIGYSGMGYATEHVKALKIARRAGDPAYPPTLQTAIDGTYPIARPLNMYTLGEPTGHIKAYLDWILSDAGQKIVEETGYVSIPKEQRVTAMKASGE